MLIERRPLARLERSHRDRLRIALMREKDRQVSRFDIAESDARAHRGVIRD
jgi:hypothetical protein